LWTLQPTLSLRCPGTPLGTITLSVSTASTLALGSDLIVFTLPVWLPVGEPVSATGQVALSPAGAFGGSAPFSNSFSNSNLTVAGDGTLTVDGQFSGTERFTAHVQVTLQLTFTTPVLTTQSQCEAVDETVTGTRS
jgi:hypothetical protein